MTERYRPLGGKLLTGEFYFLGILALLGGYFMIRRFVFGIGDIANLSDGFPWGLWITYDVVVGTALACGGYAMAILVYVFHRGRFHPLVRAALLTSVFGYTLAGVSIVVDVGRYWQLYNVFLPQHINLRSVMLEVALCVTSYTLVLWIEFSPAILEAVKASRALRLMRHILFFFIGLGILLPTMHQSSLGSLLIVAGYKVHPLWQTNLIPLLFLLTAIAMGYGMVVFESLYASVNLGRRLETAMLARIAAIIPWLLFAWILLRMGDLALAGKLGLLLEPGPEPILFAAEMALILYAALSLSFPGRRTDPTALFWSALAAVLGGAWYRFNAFLIAYDPGPGWHYFPSVGEIMITLGFSAMGIMAYLFFVKKTPVLTADPPGHRSPG